MQQGLLFYGAVAIVGATALVLARISIQTALVWLIGAAIGFTVQRSKFCFAASVRDLILFRTGVLARAVLLLIVLSTLGFAVIQYLDTGIKIPGKVYPAGFHILFGAILFGFGMVFAGGCVSSSIMRAGECFAIYWVAIIGIIFGSLLAAYTYPWWRWMIGMVSSIHLPTVLGWGPAILVEVLLFYGVLTLIRHYEGK